MDASRRPVTRQRSPLRGRPAPVPSADRFATPGADGVEVALLDRDGVIVAVNQAWRDFCTDNDGDLALCGPGVSYLRVCEAAGDDAMSRRVAGAVRSAIAGELPAAVRVRLPCDAPGVPRWFDVLISSRFDDAGRCVGATVTAAQLASPLGPQPDAEVIPLTGVGVDRKVRLRRRALTESAFRAAFEQSPVGIAMLRLYASGHAAYLRANPALAAILGEPAERLVGVDLAEFTLAEDVDVDRTDIVQMAMGRLQQTLRHQRYRRRDGSTMLAEVRISVIDLPDLDGVTALAHVVDVTERHVAERHREERAALASVVAQVATSVLAGQPLGQVYQRVVQGVATMFAAQNAALALPAPGGGELEVVAAVGPQARVLREGMTATGQPLGAGLVSQPFTVLPPRSFGSEERPRPTLGPGAAARFGAEPLGPGVLTVTRAPGGQPFDATEAELLVGLLQQLALAIELGHARGDQERLAVLVDRQRIARDLHDTVLQDLIGIGLQVKLHRGRESDPAHREQAAQLLDQLDDAVLRLRSVVSHLNEPYLEQSLAETLQGIVAVAARALGHEPQLALLGAVEAVPREVAAEVAAVLREALSNVTRHAGARSSQVRLAVGDHVLELVVEDDGQGLPARVGLGNGIRNIRHRATALGGRAVLDRSASGGTRLTLTCPIA